MKQEAKLGVLGGMGPQATQVFYQFVLDRTDAARDQDHLPALILSDTGIPDRTTAILSGDTEGLYRRLLGDAKLLEGCGCTALAIPCNTSHYFADRLQGEIGVPIIHMLRETAKLLAAQGKKHPGILGTDGTIRTDHPKELAESMLMLSDVWINPIIQPTTPDEICARCAVYNRLFGAFGIDGLIDQESVDALMDYAEMTQRLHKGGEEPV